MLQRIQTLFLLGVLAACAACYFLPFWVYAGVNPDYTYEITLFSVKCTGGTPQYITFGTLPILVLVSVSAVLSLVSLVNYKKRSLQVRVNNYNLLMTLIFTGTIFLWIPYIFEQNLPLAVSQWQPGLLLPLLSIVFLLLANVFIRKDEKLVKSADRLR
jgi:hypothetical protein